MWYESGMHHDEVIPILDFGSQYAQLIARRVREKGVYSELVRPDISIAELKKKAGFYTMSLLICTRLYLMLPTGILK